MQPNEQKLLVTSLDGSDPSIPPGPDELEISIFGPGYGECIVVHVGLNEWLVIDSCRSSADRRPEALKYFDGLGVEVDTAVKRVIATHWHDDHIGGLGEVFSAAQQAEFWCSSALRGQEWLTLVDLHSNYCLSGGSGVTEMTAIMKELKRRVARSTIASPKFAIEGLPIFKRPSSQKKVAAEIVAYAPSNAAVLSMHQEFSSKLARSRQNRGRLPSMGRNDGSVVLSVTFGQVSVLLGADLEEHGIGGLGWSAVLQYLATNPLRHSGLKVPHHGSVTGHHPDVWPTLMHEGSWAVVTPWKLGGNRLPKEEDARRILAESAGQAYLTAPPYRAKYVHPNSTVHRALWEMGAEPTKDIGKQGHVRLRCSTNTPENWTIELFGDACPMTNVQFSA